MRVKLAADQPEKRMNEFNILILTPEANILTACQSLLADEPYGVIPAKTYDEALKVLERENVKVVICDQDLPERSGLEFIKYVNGKIPHIVGLLLVETSQNEIAEEALTKGEVYRFFNKPVQDSDFKITVRRAIERCDLVTENLQLKKEIKNAHQQQKTFVNNVSEKLKSQITSVKTTIDIMDTELSGVLDDSKKNFITEAKNNVDKICTYLDETFDPAKMEDGLPAIQQDSKTQTAKTVLIIDDEVNLVNLLKIHLKGKGYNVITAYDGLEGLEKLKIVTPDLIILDINMPKMNGLEFYNEITTKHGRTNYPILMLTSRASLEETFREIDVAGFIPKPFAIDSLVKEVDRIANAQLYPRVYLFKFEENGRTKKIAATLEEEKYEVVSVENFTQLKDQAQTKKPQFILLEYTQDVMGGATLVRIIKDDPFFDSVPVVVYSYAASKEFKDRSLKAGANKYLDNPENPGNIIKAIRELELNASR